MSVAARELLPRRFWTGSSSRAAHTDTKHPKSGVGLMILKSSLAAILREHDVRKILQCRNRSAELESCIVA